MLKVFIVMVSLAGILFYFLRGYVAGDTQGDKVNTSTGKTVTDLQKLAALPGSIKESSGIEVLQKGQYITHNDAGNSAQLYQIDAKGELIKSNRLNIPNVDWEDLTRDDKGNIYIADTGNNDNNRKELAVYKVSAKDMMDVSAIRFTYEDQKEFPPSKKDRNFDSEAIFWNDGQLYVITKDRGLKKTANIYQLPDAPGTYKAKLIGSAEFNGEVTGAAISPDGKLVVLLEEERLHLFSDFKEPAAFYEGKSETVDLAGAGQTEAVAFEDNNTLIITSEGSNLYRYKL